jgi:Protein of unknown function (DUF4065)
MADFTDLGRKVTYRFELPGGQRRLKEASLYVMKRARLFDYFGLVKLNKTLWLADFSSYRERRYPVTGRLYQKLANGPAPVEMRPLLNEMERDGIISLAATAVPNEQRPVANVEPMLNDFSEADIEFIDRAIEYYRPMTAAQASEDSHGVAWRTRELGDDIPYDAAIFDDREMPQAQEHKLKWMARERRWRSL